MCRTISRFVPAVPTTSRFPSIIGLAAFAAVLFVVAGSAQAQTTYFWDPLNGASPTGSDSSSAGLNWDQLSTLWYNDTTSTDTAFTNDPTATVNIGTSGNATANTITMGDVITVGTINFNGGSASGARDRGLNNFPRNGTALSFG